MLETPPAADSPAATAAFPATELQLAETHRAETRRRQTTPPADRPELAPLQKKTCSCSCRRCNKPHRPAKCSSGPSGIFSQALSAGCGSHTSIITTAVHSFTAESCRESSRISDSRTGKWRVLARKVQNVVTDSCAAPHCSPDPLMNHLPRSDRLCSALFTHSLIRSVHRRNPCSTSRRIRLSNESFVVLFMLGSKATNHD